MEIKYQRQAFMEAADHGLLHYGQVDPLLQFLKTHPVIEVPSRFNGTTVLYYLGGLLAIAACSLFSTLAVERWGMSVLLDLGLLYMVMAVSVAVWLDRRGLGIPASLLATLAVALVPLVGFALMQVLGVWSDEASVAHYRDFHRWIDWHWLLLEVATLVAGVVMLWRFRYSFLVMPIAVVLFYMGMDIVPALLLHGDPHAQWFAGSGWVVRQEITLVFGLCLLVAAFIADLHSDSDQDYAFWLYLSGLATFWGALSSMGDGALSGKLVYLAINLGLIMAGTMLARRSFLAFGGLGVVLALGNLAWTVFADSFAFMALLTVIGFALIVAGYFWNKYALAVRARLRKLLPRSVQMRLVLRH